MEEWGDIPDSESRTMTMHQIQMIQIETDYVRYVIDHINRVCKHVYQPTRERTIDESLILFKGRLFFKQTIRSKRARAGVKLYPLCCTSSGIKMGLRVYAAEAIPFEDVQDGYEFSKKEQNFLDLMDSCFK